MDWRAIRLKLSALRYSGRWQRIRYRWLARWECAPFETVIIVAAFAGLVALAGTFAYTAYASHANLEAKRLRNVDLNCLAKNVYHEARGEPVDGQLAVAEVTLNRVAADGFPDSVCAVVMEQRWDPRRQRNVGMFSWTEIDGLEPPQGDAWHRSISIAAKAYDGKHDPLVAGALYYHADSIEPPWASSLERVGKIGRHVFYE